MEAAIIVIGVVSLLSIVTLRQDVAGTAGADTASLVTTGQSLVATRDWTFLLGPDLMAGINALLLGSLMYRSRLVPRVIPLMGLIGGPLLITASIAIMFGAPSWLWSSRSRSRCGSSPSASTSSSKASGPAGSPPK